MSTKSQVAKDKRNKFRRRRGTFKPFSDESTNDAAFIDNSLRRFWSQRMTGGSSVDRSHIPDGSRPYFDYKGHVAYRPPHKLDDSTPRSIFHLATLFPGARFVSKEREDVKQKMRELFAHDTDPERNFVVERNRFHVLRLYFTPADECWWFVHQERYTIKSSITYGGRKRALQMWRTNQISWKVEHVFTPDSS